MRAAHLLQARRAVRSSSLLGGASEGSAGAYWGFYVGTVSMQAPGFVFRGPSLNRAGKAMVAHEPENGFSEVDEFLKRGCFGGSP